MPQHQVFALEIDTPAITGGKGGRARSSISPFAPDVSLPPWELVRSSAVPRVLTLQTSSKGGRQPSPKKGRQQGREEERRAAPEKTLTLFAARLAVLEKIASQVGTLSFIWATVVLLGGFAITLKEKDFWFVTVILVIEGARIFSRSHQLEWEHQDAGATAGMIDWVYQQSSGALVRSKRMLESTFTMKAERKDEVRLQISTKQPMQQSYGEDLHTGDRQLTRTWSVSKVPLFPRLERILTAKISRLLYWMQLFAACIAVALSVYRLRTHDFTRDSEVDSVKNHSSALFIFYSLATFEALVFLLERSYWQYQITIRKILVRVNEMCGLSIQDLRTTKHFFYDVYSQCLRESIFEGLKMDMVAYALTWLQSEKPREQLGGLRVLNIFSAKEEFAEYTLRTIVVKQGSIERLLEMVTWNHPAEHDIRKAAANLLYIMAKSNLYSNRVAAIAGSVEGIFSLLTSYDGDEEGAPRTAEYAQHGAALPLSPWNVEMHIIGLRILKKLAKDPHICATIGLIRGLLFRLISFIDTDPAMFRNSDESNPRILLIKKSLDLLNIFASASGSSGEMLRERMAKVVYTISNLHTILKYGQGHTTLQMLATDILCSLAMDKDVSVMIGRTGGVMRSLAELLLRGRMSDNAKEKELAELAGETLALLVSMNKENCHRMLSLTLRQGEVVDNEGRGCNEEAGRERVRMDVLEALMKLMSDWEVGDLAMRIMRSLFKYSGHAACKRRVAEGTVREAIMLLGTGLGRAQEAAIGLLAIAVGELSEEELCKVMKEEAMSPVEMAAKLERLLERNLRVSTQLPCLRRYVIELTLALTELHKAVFLPVFEEVHFASKIRLVADSISELENYATFSGASGVMPFTVPMSELVDTAMHRFRKSPSPSPNPSCT
ncbi:hypothetical protein KP509_37G065100 [Ceratopteris richardii]|uniref:Uncharacterized protein n=1 Tax=Ceratopteris richardii TaxID=49495 RepID=A0A8T2Q9F1_CERRI|nr:hypothetical protein KP509_37G065100 [Ceratopteris richardii]